MSQPANFHYVIELLDRESGESLGREAIAAPDFEPALRGASFQSWCDQVAAASSSELLSSTYFANPSWHPSLGRPHVDGIEAEIEASVPATDSPRFHSPIQIFDRDAAAFANRLVVEKKIETGASYRYRVAAYPTGAESSKSAADKSHPGISFDDDSEDDVSPFPRPAVDTTSGASDTITTPHDIEHAAADDFVVFLPKRVLDQTSAMAENAGGREIGGFLVGHFCRIDGRPATVVSDQIPARHTDRAEMSLTLTPRTWQALDDTLKLRARGEIVLGWHHLHPASSWCKKCAEDSADDQARRTRLDACAYQRVFFSEADRQTSRAAFAVPYQVGLLVVDTTLDGVQFGMFGWRNGILGRRAFFVVDDTASLLP